MSRTYQRIEFILTRLLIAIPWLALAAMWLFSVRVAVDLPVLDDWDYYRPVGVGSFSLDFLFRPANDTIFATGRLLDSIFFQLFRGNAVVVQAITLPLVLGSLLLLQWKLLRTAFDERVVVASAFALTLMMLQANSYWGIQSLAYHQALPIVALLAVIAIAPATRWRERYKMTLIFVVALAGALSYISGAFAGLGGAAALFLISVMRPHRTDLRLAAISLGAAAALASVAQGYVVLVRNKGAVHGDIPWASPLSPDFWLFALGKIARSLALPVDRPELSLAGAWLAVLAIATIVLIALRRLSRLAQNERGLENRYTIFLFLAACLATYLAMVASSRAYHRPPHVDTTLEIFRLGYTRFHYFWLTLVWPWVFAFLASALVARQPRIRTRAAVMAIASLLAGSVVLSGWFNYPSDFKTMAAQKTAGIACIQNQLITKADIYCPSIFPASLNRAYARAVALNASFVASVPPSLRLFNTSPELRLADATITPDTVRNAELTIEGTTVRLTSNGDALIEFPPVNQERMQDCQMIALRATVEAAPGEIAALSAMPRWGQSETQASQSIATNGQPVSLVISSRNGFRGNVRFKPITGVGDARVSEVSVRCLVPRR